MLIGASHRLMGCPINVAHNVASSGLCYIFVCILRTRIYMLQYTCMLERMKQLIFLHKYIMCYWSQQVSNISQFHSTTAKYFQLYRQCNYVFMSLHNVIRCKLGDWDLTKACTSIASMKEINTYGSYKYSPLLWLHMLHTILRFICEDVILSIITTVIREEVVEAVIRSTIWLDNGPI